MGQGIIAFDIDGVLANFTRGFTRIAHQLYGTPVGDSECQQTWDFEDFPELRLDKAKSAFDGPVWTEIKNSNTFWAMLDPKNPSVMPRINKIENKVFITNRPGVNTKEQSIQFLESWGIENPRVIVVDGHNKGDIAIRENVVAVIDDLYKNVVDIHKSVANCYSALLYCAYNKVYHEEWLNHHCGDIVLSVDQFIDECYDRKLVVDVSYEDSDTVDARIREILNSL